MGQGALYWRRSGSESSAQWLQLDRSSGGGSGGGGSGGGGGGSGGGSVVVIITHRDVWPAMLLGIGSSRTESRFKHSQQLTRCDPQWAQSQRKLRKREERESLLESWPIPSWQTKYWNTVLKKDKKQRG